MFWAEIWKLSDFFLSVSVFGGGIFNIVEQAYFRNGSRNRGTAPERPVLKSLKTDWEGSNQLHSNEISHKTDAAPKHKHAHDRHRVFPPSHQWSTIAKYKQQNSNIEIKQMAQRRPETTAKKKKKKKQQQKTKKKNKKKKKKHMPVYKRSNTGNNSWDRSGRRRHPSRGLTSESQRPNGFMWLCTQQRETTLGWTSPGQQWS